MFSLITVNSFLQYEVTQPFVLVGLLLGAATVFLFSSLAINAVTRAAGAIVVEVRRQFREHPGIMDRTETPEYGRVVDICTRDSLRELAAPGLLAILSPVVVGFGIGTTALAGFLAGVIGTGAVMGVFLANSGGAWDNAKKIVEDGAHGGRARAPTRRRSSATPSATPSRTPPARPSTPWSRSSTWWPSSSSRPSPR